jgi:hypothetical protein
MSQFENLKMLLMYQCVNLKMRKILVRIRHCEVTKQSLQGNKQIASKGTPSVFSCVEATFPSLGEGAYC